MQRLNPRPGAVARNAAPIADIQPESFYTAAIQSEPAILPPERRQRALTGIDNVVRMTLERRVPARPVH
jgi:hypothetical protein